MEQPLQEQKQKKLDAYIYRANYFFLRKKTKFDDLIIMHKMKKIQRIERKHKKIHS